MRARKKHLLHLLKALGLLPAVPPPDNTSLGVTSKQMGNATKPVVRQIITII